MAGLTLARGGGWRTPPVVPVMAPRIRVRPAAVAGLFYPGEPAALRATVESLLAVRRRPEAAALASGVASVAGAAPAALAPGNALAPESALAPGAAGAAPATKALIAPHAGYSYSGPIAGSAFAALTGSAHRVRRVVLLGPSHRVPLRGLGLPGADAFATPLGTVAIDVAGAAAVGRLPQVSVRPDAHEAEHSLEVELPFLQVVLGAFDLLPLVVGEADGEEVAEVLEAAWGGDETLLVISSDLSHFLPAEAAERADRETAARILALAGPLAARQACGAAPLNGLLVAARRHRLAPRQLDLRHSGDTAGDRARVVGYGAWAFDAA